MDLFLLVVSNSWFICLKRVFLYLSNYIFVYSFKIIFVYWFKCNFVYSFKCIFVYSFKCVFLYLHKIYLCLLDIAKLPSVVSHCWEYCFTQTNNHKRILKLTFYYTFTLLKINVLLSTLLCYKYCQNPVFLNFEPCIHTSGYFLRCLTKQRHNCLMRPEVSSNQFWDLVSG